MSIVMKKIIKSMFAKFCFFEKAAWGDAIFEIRMGNLLKFNTNNWLEFDISMIFFLGGEPWEVLCSVSTVSALRLVWKKMKGQHGTLSGFSDIVSSIENENKTCF